MNYTADVMESKSPRLGSVVRALLPLLIYISVALFMSWPLLLEMDTHVLGSIDHPGLKGDLFYQHDLHQQMKRGMIPSHNRIISLCYPEGLDLTQRDAFALHLLFYVLLMPLFGLLASHNLALLLALVLNAACMHKLIRERVRSEPFAYLGGFLFGFGPYIFLKVQQGFPQKAFLFFIPLFVLSLLRALERDRRRDIILCGVYLLGALTVYPPYALFGVIFAAPLVLGTGLRQKNLRALCWRFLPLVLLLGGVFLLLAQAVASKETVAINSHNYHRLGGYLDLARPFLWRPYAHTFDLPPAPFVADLTLGFPALLTMLALAAGVMGLGRARWLWLGVALMLTIMAGPFLTTGGAPGSGAASTWRLPAYILTRLPGSEAWWFPIRMYPWVLVALLLAAGKTLQRLSRSLTAAWWPAALAMAIPLLALAEHCLVFPQYGRFYVTELTTPQFYREIQQEDFPALLLLPPRSPERNRYLLDAVHSGRALVNGYWGGQITQEVPQQASPEGQKRAFLEKLARWRVRYIVVHLDLARRSLKDRGVDVPAGMPPARLLALDAWPYGWLRSLCGPARIYAGDGMAVYRVAAGGGPR